MNRHLFALYERARLKVVDEQGHWKPEEVEAELKELIAAGLPETDADLLLEDQARYLVREAERSRHPRRLKAPGGSLYHPDAIVPLGGDRVLMRDAGPDDLNAWNEIIARNLANQATAGAENLGYNASRLAAFRTGNYTCLHEIEVDLFGWQDDDS